MFFFQVNYMFVRQAKGGTCQRKQYKNWILWYSMIRRSHAVFEEFSMLESQLTDPFICVSNCDSACGHSPIICLQILGNIFPWRCEHV